ncbi:MAG: class I SAM-dependent methyltransferase [Rhodocyclaceae bacterium]|nr:class I SAM-dependent methyltransferase [Rhodocyclaceae bacterium]MBX3667816.1 class I SAM-dependent methyltransferase [Rhodocyclaceae bacterium]
MWDERYSAEQYAYGTEPNDFLAQNYRSIPKGRVLSLAEGEGRNAVFLARQGYAVTAVDASAVGLEKARKLAAKHGVDVELIHADLANYDLGDNAWDGIISIFCPLPPAVRRTLYARLAGALKPGGVFLLEAYTPDQIRYGTGGGNSAEVMQTRHSLADELAGLRFMHLAEMERSVVEGIYHTGLAAVVQAIAVRDCNTAG